MGPKQFVSFVKPICDIRRSRTTHSNPKTLNNVAERPLRVQQPTGHSPLADSPLLFMNHSDHVTLLRDGIPEPGGVWAELGSGNGAFTLALAELLGPAAHIYSVDKKKNRLRRQEREVRERFPGTRLETITADYTRPLNLPPLDGLVMANALHFQHHKDGVLQLIYNYLRPGGRLILIEYNVDRGNFWVRHPLSYPTWERLAARNGFVGTRLLQTRPSSFLREIYSAVSRVVK